ncbi:hypothetical protein SLEP1_g10550 [Rubroshorea leprosula]|uniref:Protein kinase domain-containing protein n=1 Tax=Rubroshorea leprosula TaxID=152421 RepID=A0AAV5IID0_9ROSI|nr:hypothetical protein SLEP1_g10550 [Rubroshorea leprosula]
MLHNSMTSSIRRIHKPFHRKRYHSTCHVVVFYFLDQILVNLSTGLLSQLRHQNLVRLFSFCKEKDERMLVYEYLNHGALRDHLHKGGDPLPWKQRLEICIEAALMLQRSRLSICCYFGSLNTTTPTLLLGVKAPCTILLKQPQLLFHCSFPSLDFATSNKFWSFLGLKIWLLGHENDLMQWCKVYLIHRNVKSSNIILDKNWVAKLANFRVSKMVPPSTSKPKVLTKTNSRVAGKIAPVCLIEFLEIAFSCIHPKASERPTMGEVEVTLVLELWCQSYSSGSKLKDKRVCEAVKLKVNLMSFNLLEAEDLQEARSKNVGLMMFYVAGVGGVLCYSISPKRQGWLVKVQIGTMIVLNIASSHFHDRVAKSLAQESCTRCRR